MVLFGRGGKSPTPWQHICQTLGRSFREVGQALDRMGLKLESFTWLPDKYVGGDPPVRYQDFLSRHQTYKSLLYCGKPVIHPNVAFVAPCATLLGSVRVQQNASIWYGAVLRADTCLNAKSFQLSDEEILNQEKTLRLNPGEVSRLEKDKEDETEEEREQQQGNNSDEEPDLREYKIENIGHRSDPYDQGGAIYVGPDSNLQDGVLVTARQGSTVIGQGVTVGHLAQIHSSTVEDYALIGMGSILGEGSRIETESLVAAGAVIPPMTTVGVGELWVGQPARKVRDLTTEERQKLHFQSSEYVQVALTQQGVMELGGNLGPEVPLLDAIHQIMEDEKANQESMPDKIARMNKWNNTVYREYVQPKPKEPALEAGGDENDKAEQLVKGGGDEATRKQSLLPPQQQQQMEERQRSSPSVV